MLARNLKNVTTQFESEAKLVDVENGTLEITSKGATRRESFDLVVACDGGGSAVRDALERALPAHLFGVETKHCENFSSMLHLDQNTDDLDPCYLHMFEPPPVWFVAGAVGRRDQPPHWCCQVQWSKARRFASAQEARQFLVRAWPDVVRYASDSAIADFARRDAFPTG